MLPRRLHGRAEPLAVARQHQLVPPARHQQHGRRLRVHMIDRLRACGIGRLPEHALRDRAVERVEVIGARKPDHARKRRSGRRRQPLRIEGQCRRIIGTGRMSGEHQPRPVPSMAGNIVAHPFHGPGTVPHEGGIFGVRHQPIVRHRHNIAQRRQRMGGKAVMAAAPLAPRSAIEKHHHRQRALAGLFRGIDIQPVPRIRAIGHRARQAAHAAILGHQCCDEIGQANGKTSHVLIQIRRDRPGGFIARRKTMPRRRDNL